MFMGMREAECVPSGKAFHSENGSPSFSDTAFYAGKRTPTNADGSLGYETSPFQL